MSKITYGPREINGEYPVFSDGVFRGWVCRHLSYWSYGLVHCGPMISYSRTRSGAVEALVAL